MRYNPNKSCGKFLHSDQDGGTVTDFEELVHIFNLFVC